MLPSFLYIPPPQWATFISVWLYDYQGGIIIILIKMFFFFSVPSVRGAWKHSEVYECYFDLNAGTSLPDCYCI